MINKNLIIYDNNAWLYYSISTEGDSSSVILILNNVKAIDKC